jgi:uncharacterized protein with PIN domain
VTPGEETSPPSGAPRFLVDAMLGRLARWLRYLGYDTVYDAENPDDVLARRALAEGRVLLTRDRGLLERWRPPDAVLVQGDRPAHQLRQVVRELGLGWREPRGARCTLCNEPLKPDEADEAAGRVPPYVHRRHAGSFTRCPKCGRFYWPGTHAERMERLLADLLGDLSPT